MFTSTLYIFRPKGIFCDKRFSALIEVDREVRECRSVRGGTAWNSNSLWLAPAMCSPHLPHALLSNMVRTESWVRVCGQVPELPFPSLCVNRSFL